MLFVFSCFVLCCFVSSCDVWWLPSLCDGSRVLAFWGLSQDAMTWQAGLAAPVCWQAGLAAAWWQSITVAVGTHCGIMLLQACCLAHHSELVLYTCASLVVALPVKVSAAHKLTGSRQILCMCADTTYRHTHIYMYITHTDTQTHTYRHKVT